ncbi:hypothetical protein SRHO_G00232740 [Serrasalmus rhombeus]
MRYCIDRCNLCLRCSCCPRKGINLSPCSLTNHGQENACSSELPFQHYNDRRNMFGPIQSYQSSRKEQKLEAERNFQHPAE